MLVTILVIAGFILFVLAALNVPNNKITIGWAACACLTLAYLLTHWPH